MEPGLGLQLPSVYSSISLMISEPDIGFSFSSLSTWYRRKPLGTIAVCLIHRINGIAFQNNLSRSISQAISTLTYKPDLEPEAPNKNVA